MSKSKSRSGDTSGGVRVDAGVRRRRALELRKQGLTFKEIGNHPEIGPVSVERARQIVGRAEMDLKIQGNNNLDRAKFIESHPDLLNTSIEDLEFSVRTNICLRNANITTIGELIKRTEASMLATRGFGKMSLKEIKEELTRLGMSLAT